MNKSAILALAIVLLSVAIVSGTNICDNAPCEPQINTSIGTEFTLSLESNPSTGFEWWTKFDPNYLSLTNSIFVGGNEKSGMVGVPGKGTFTFNAKSAGNTDVIMLLLQPWENGTIAERKIFPINIMSAAPPALKQATSIDESTMETPSQVVSQAPPTRSEASSLSVTSESSMETPSEVVSQSTPTRSEAGSISKPSFNK
jgi:predicted secreted protein